MTGSEQLGPILGSHTAEEVLEVCVHMAFGGPRGWAAHGPPWPDPFSHRRPPQSLQLSHSGGLHCVPPLGMPQAEVVQVKEYLGTRF